MCMSSIELAIDTSSTNDLWSQCLSYLAETVEGSDNFHSFIAPLQAIEGSDKFIIYAPNQYVFSQIRQRYLSVLDQAIRHCGLAAHIKIVLKVGNPTTPAAKPSKQEEARPSPLNPQFTFESFISGPSNEFAFAAAQQTALSPGQSYNPFVIFGSTGLGKTHLMHAIGQEIVTHNPRAVIVYLHAEKFLSEMIQGFQRGTMDAFKEKLRSADVLLLDDIQFFANKERCQEELFHRFNEKLEDNKQVILTSDRYPKELNGFEDRLKSRFTWGLSVGIDPPELETRVAILIQKAHCLGFDLPQDVAFFIADKIQTNVRELEGILKRLLAHAQFTGVRIDLSFTKNALRDLLTIHSRQVSVERIIQAVARYYKIKTNDITGKRRQQVVARPRQLAMFLAKRLTSRSLPEIGRLFGGRDHTTVLYACQKMAQLIVSDADLKVDYDNLSNELSH